MHWPDPSADCGRPNLCSRGPKSPILRGGQPGQHLGPNVAPHRKEEGDLLPRLSEGLPLAAGHDAVRRRAHRQAPSPPDRAILPRPRAGLGLGERPVKIQILHRSGHCSSNNCRRAHVCRPSSSDHLALRFEPTPRTEGNQRAKRESHSVTCGYGQAPHCRHLLAAQSSTAIDIWPTPNPLILELHRPGTAIAHVRGSRWRGPTP